MIVSESLTVTVLMTLTITVSLTLNVIVLATLNVNECKYVPDCKLFCYTHCQ